MNLEKRKLFIYLALLFLFFVIVTMGLCYYKANQLKIVSIKIPTMLYGLQNDKEFPNTDIIYYYSDQDLNIEITFNKELKNESRYNFYFFQCGRYIPIVHENSNIPKRYFFYSIEKNKIRIYGIKGMLPSGFVVLNVPGELRTVDGNKFGKDKKIILSPNKLTPHERLTWVNMVYRDVKTLAVPKMKKDGKKVIYINQNNIPFLKNKNDEKWFELMRGESAIVLGEEGDFYKIVMYSPKQPANEINIINGNEDVYTDKYTTSYIGYVQKQYATELPEPLNQDTIYAVFRNDSMISEDIEPDAHLVVIAPLIGGNTVYFPKTLEPLKTWDFYSLESISNSEWNVMLIGNTYQATHADEKGTLLSDFHPNSHIPEYYWNEDEYKKYKSARREYVEYIENQFKNYKVLPEYKEFQEELYPFAFNALVKLQDIWIDWGYINKVKSADWLFERILNEFDFSPDERKKYEKLFKEKQAEDPDMDLNMKLMTFYNEYIIKKKAGDIIQNTLNQFNDLNYNSDNNNNNGRNKD